MILSILMLVFGIIVVIAGIVSVVMAFVKGEEITSKKVLVPGGICIGALILFIVMYMLI